MKAVARPRLDRLLDQAWQHPVTLVLAPAGSGKTTAVAEFATRAEGPVIWLTCGGIDSASSFTAHLSAAWRAARSVGGPAPAPVAIVLDDVHALVGTSAEEALAELVTDVVDGESDAAHLLLVGRREPNLDLTRVRLMGDLLLVQSDDLRFRAWEAEQLFRELYDTWLRPSDIARLAQRVDGWAAGLQLFHLAARGLSPVDQRRLVDRLNGRTRIVREFLVSNVLEPLDPALRTFLIDTSVLSVVTPELADELRGASDSAEHLRELARGQLFTTAVDDESYRYHEVLRAQLEVLLLERDGEQGAAERHRAAGRLLEARSLHHDALHCYARAADWAAVRRLVVPAGDHIHPPSIAWIQDLPASLVADDPWLLLVRARAEHLAGRWYDANASYAAAASKGLGEEFAAQCRPARAELAAWSDPMAMPPDGPLSRWIGPARAGCRRDPAGAAQELERQHTPAALVAAAALWLLAGDIERSRRAAEDALADDVVGPCAEAAAMLVLACTDLLAGVECGVDLLDEAESQASRSGFGWLARLARACHALSDRPSGVDEARRVHAQCLEDGDLWGAALSALVGAIGARRSASVPDAWLAGIDSVASCHVLGGSVLDAVRGWISRVGVIADGPAARLAIVGSSTVGPSTVGSGTVGSGTVGSGTVGSGPDGSGAEARQSSDDPVLRIECLGRFHVFVDGKPLDLESLRPRARALLKLLAIHPDNGLHRESIIELLWPDNGLDSGIRNLQVAVSAVRRLLANAGVPDEFGIRRHGESYRLVVPRTDASDLAHFLERTTAATSAAARGDRAATHEAAVEALRAYGGELLVEDGPVEFAVRERSRIEAMHQRVAALAAEGFLLQGHLLAAIDVCEEAIAQHPYADELWRLLVRAHHQRGDAATAGQAQARYEHVLAELAS